MDTNADSMLCSEAYTAPVVVVNHGDLSWEKSKALKQVMDCEKLSSILQKEQWVKNLPW